MEDKPELTGEAEPSRLAEMPMQGHVSARASWGRDSLSQVGRPVEVICARHDRDALRKGESSWEQDELVGGRKSDCWAPAAGSDAAESGG